MTLSSLIRKRDTGKLATAIPAISATQQNIGTSTVARIAIVAVANPREEKTVPPLKTLATLSADEEKAIRDWLALIEETDPATIAEVIERCQKDVDARGYFTSRAEEELPKPDPYPDDRRTCSQCQNLRGRICTIAKPGGLVSANRGYRPATDTLQRCAGYLPNATDPDRRHGRERWPALVRKYI